MPTRSKKSSKPSRRESKAPQAPPATSGPPDWAVTLVIVVSICVVYFPALNVPFIYDDNATIVGNPSIVSLRPIIGTRDHPGPLNPAVDLPTSGRPLVNLSLAINYAFGGLDPFGYHVFNLAIHILAAMLVWLIVRCTLRLSYFANRFATSADWLAIATAMLWALHPLQTEAVIYVTQRTELMMALFYLATLYCSLRYWSALPLPSREGPGEGSLNSSPNQRPRTHWLTLAILSSLAGMASKEVMASAPLMVLLFERTFVAGSVMNALRRSWPLYVGLASTWILLVILAVTAPHGDTAGFNLRISPSVWWLTQAKVFWMYLELAVWPSPLLIHYELPLLHTFSEAWIYVLPVFLLAIATLILLWRNHPLGYLGTWVFAILSPTSFVPIVTEIAAERRMYLPLMAIIILAVVGGWLVAQKLSPFGRGQVAQDSPRRREGASVTRKSHNTSMKLRIIVPTLLLSVIFGLADTKRIHAYRDETGLWREVIEHQPQNLVARNNLADLLVRAGRSSEAIVELHASLAIKPDQPIARNNLGLMLANTGQHQQAVQQFQASLALEPTDPKTHFNLGIALANMGSLSEAIDSYEHALKLRPNFTDAHVNLGVALAGAGRTDDAISHFQRALQIEPSRIDAHTNLAEMSRQAGRPGDAIKHYQIALQLKPDDFHVHFYLAEALALANRPQEAIATAERAIDIARKAGQQSAAHEFQKWLQNYRTELAPKESR